MKVIIWGCTGSLPVALQAEQIRHKIIRALHIARSHQLDDDAALERFVDRELPFSVGKTYGGNTSCVEIQGGEECVILDAGTGIRDLGRHIMQTGRPVKNFHLFFSHLHWDHLQGFPFFLPAFVKGNRIDFYSGHDGLEDALRLQQNPPFFPVDIDYMKSDKVFHRLAGGSTGSIAGFDVSVIEQSHPGGSFGYSFERNGKKIVYSTDSEHNQMDSGFSPAFLDFCRDADLLIFDAQYSLMDAWNTKENWGHSSNILGVEAAMHANVKHLCLFHREPTINDETLDKIQQDTRVYAGLYDVTRKILITQGYDGLEIEL